MAKMIEVDKGERRNGVVLEVRVVFNYLVEIIFQRTSRGIRETSRGLISGERLYDRDKLWIPDAWYKKIIRQIWAIFNERRGSNEI